MISCHVETDPEFVITPPWYASPESCERELRSKVGFDGLLVAVFNTHDPRTDEILLASGIEGPSISKWVHGLPDGDVRFQKALSEAMVKETRPGAGDEGSSIGIHLSSEDNESEAGARDGLRHVLFLAAPARFGTDRAWFAAFWRRGTSPEFNEEEVGTLQRTLVQWASRFNSPHEPEMIRLLLGTDDRVVLSDPAGEQTLLDSQIDMRETMSQLRNIVAQRWPDMSPGDTHDLVVEIADRAWWCRFHSRRIDDLGEQETEGRDPWYLELRPLDANEMMPVGLIDDDRVARALAYIHDNYCESLSLQKISERVGISLFHFHRLFSQHVGVTPKQYILQKQMQVARWMLRARNTPISRIADNIGFASHGHFTSTFTRIVGMSPTEYREWVRSD